MNRSTWLVLRLFARWRQRSRVDSWRRKYRRLTPRWRNYSVSCVTSRRTGTACSWNSTTLPVVYRLQRTSCRRPSEPKQLWPISWTSCGKPSTKVQPLTQRYILTDHLITLLHCDVLATAAQSYVVTYLKAKFKKIVMPDLFQQGRQIVTRALNRTAVTLGFARYVSESIVCDCINWPGDLDL